MIVKHFACGAMVLSLLTVSALAGAAEPVTLTNDQMDTVAAGGLRPPTTSELASVGALAWATSGVTTSPGVTAILEGNVTVQVGLAGNRITFANNSRIILPN